MSNFNQSDRLNIKGQKWANKSYVHPKTYTPLNEVEYVDTAERIVKNGLGKNNRNEYYLTNSQIRIILDLINEVYSEVKQKKDETLTEEEQGRINYCRMKIAYQAGRDNTGAVKDFVDKSDILEHLKQVQSSRKKFVLTAHYVEALVAYHRFYNEKKNG